jgi:hypothetical protein
MKLPEWIRKRFANWAWRVVSSRESDFDLIGDDGRPYLLRWYIIPPNPVLSVYVHCFAGPDFGRHLHDHRSGSLSLILEGRYIEKSGTPRMMRTRVGEIREHRKGDIVYRPARVAHMVAETYGAMTIFITGPTIRKWGFWVDGKWIYWRTYLKQQTTGPK